MYVNIYKGPSILVWITEPTYCKVLSCYKNGGIEVMTKFIIETASKCKVFEHGGNIY